MSFYLASQMVEPLKYLETEVIENGRNFTDVMMEVHDIFGLEFWDMATLAVGFEEKHNAWIVAKLEGEYQRELEAGLNPQ